MPSKKRLAAVSGVLATAALTVAAFASAPAHSPATAREDGTRVLATTDLNISLHSLSTSPLFSFS
ncbi:hypothetical protein DPM19_21070 [Actinomadura craniellae]|uniref:Uncharacterized protein n=1 Tax=Actinomadura craniellae TaxID=2231787 RepID=A0A365H1Q0_9ACTN|nr:hypothetical protein [Actinomadura craniellae]RAY13007.1 hypothetical protein DPM19_21070 [Actinomadura craniellae]